jgi:molecular chaperone DnaJ
MGDIFDQLFGGGMGGAPGRSNAPMQGNDLRYDLRISFEEAAFGCEKPSSSPADENCDTCHGTGAKPGTPAQDLPHLQRYGPGARVRRLHGHRAHLLHLRRHRQGDHRQVLRLRRYGPSCAVGAPPPSRCPRASTTARPIVMNGRASRAATAAPTGDLYIQITVRPHKLFKRDGTNLHLELPIYFTQAALGADIDVPTLGGGKTTVHIPEGTQNDAEIRLKGQGIQQLRSAYRGDLILHIRVEIPRRLSEKQKDLLRQFEDASSGKEYETRKSFLDKVKELFNG